MAISDIVTLVEENQKLIHLVISRHFKYLVGVYEYADLVQIGNIGLIKSAKTFDKGTGYTFSTYAVKCIWGQISNECENS